MRENRRDDLRLVAIALDEQRADRTVDQPRDQRLALRRPAFALEIAAGNAARGKRLFLIIDGERQKIDAGPRRFRRNDCGHHRRFAKRREHRAVGLARDAPGLERQLAPAPIDFFSMDIEHFSYVLNLPPPDCGRPFAALQ